MHAHWHSQKRRGRLRPSDPGSTRPQPHPDNALRGRKARAEPCDRCQKVPPIEGKERRFGPRRDSRRPRHVLEQGDLPERFARPERLHKRSVDVNVEGSFLDQIETVARLALPNDLLPDRAPPPPDRAATLSDRRP